MIKKQTSVINKLGLHARASSQLVQLASKFISDISIEKDGKLANAKSIMTIMMLAANKGSTITIMANGEDEVVAIEQISELFANKFGELE